MPGNRTFTNTLRLFRTSTTRRFLEHTSASAHRRTATTTASHLLAGRATQTSKNKSWHTVAAVGAGAIAWVALSTEEEDAADAQDDDSADRAMLSKVPLSRLLAGWIVYGCCQFPALVDASPAILDFLHAIPIVSTLTDFVVRRSFFAQFCGGETAPECVPFLKNQRDSQIGALFCYNVEAHSSTGILAPEQVQAQIAETFNAVETAGAFEAAYAGPEAVAQGATRTWIALKLTGLIADPAVLVRRTTALQAARVRESRTKGPYPHVPVDGDWEGLMQGTSASDAADIAAVIELYASLRKLMSRARELGVRVFIDAEQTWYQPAIDVIAERLMDEFNRDSPAPTVCSTFQSLLRRSDEMITSSLARAHDRGYQLGFKLVRGTYVNSEQTRWTAEGRSGPPPVWTVKADTDAAYFSGVGLILNAIKQNVQEASPSACSSSSGDCAVVFATHSAETVDHVCTELAKLGLAKADGSGALVGSLDVGKRVAFAQICGMKDALTNEIAGRLRFEQTLPSAIKYIPYGTVEEAMPYLSRRAVENKSLMAGPGGAVSERRRLGTELGRRFWQF